MNWRRATKIAIPVVTVAVILYDILAISRGGVDATISRVLLGWAQRWPVIPLGVGVLMGHLWWSQSCQRKHADDPPTK